MKLLLFTFIITFLVTLIHAIYIPEFNLQDIKAQFEGTFDTQETKLITECSSNSENLLIIKDITLNPDPPVKGQTLSIHFEGDLKERVTKGAYVNITVKLGVVQLLRKRFDFCDEIEKIDEECPIEAGKLVIDKQVDLPKLIPRGTYNVEAIITNYDGKQVTCLHGKTHFD